MFGHGLRTRERDPQRRTTAASHWLPLVGKVTLPDDAFAPAVEVKSGDPFDVITRS